MIYLKFYIIINDLIKFLYKNICYKMCILIRVVNCKGFKIFKIKYI